MHQATPHRKRVHMQNCLSSEHSTPTLHREPTPYNGARLGRQVGTTIDQEHYLATRIRSHTLCSLNQHSQHLRAIRYSSPSRTETNPNTRPPCKLSSRRVLRTSYLEGRATRTLLASERPRLQMSYST